MTRLVGAALVATLVTLVGCGGRSLRRSLITDGTPLGAPRARVLAWHREHGWCPSKLPPEVKAPAALVFLEPCGGPDRGRLDAVLVFTPDDVLAGAHVTVRVRRDLAVAIMDELGHELEARYGAPEVSTWTERRWTTPAERVRLVWIDAGAGLFLVTEEHHPRERVRGPLSTLD